ncbi:type II secretion system protein [Bdellovibrio svalbardensis]|uniref:Prepilin-type N-terminal cleavage/methylation domain-containing protein n=1 Tax=Bdellovibrio svalbardensis TaxID=2972972 RepID=A0ABT6DDP9_9BACT|nr:prepilin-type N-terminal cleavage/methylation domain-containing protein [Bdellovibrio svalbardensis]MDG0814965.1 prepilin-type N-terminal cleavage/methylation domain-containing protein [Bdellovibrio svalbardensis]
MNSRGMTLIEVMLAIGISVIGVSVFLFFVLSSRKHVTHVDRSIILKEILTDNVIELKGLQIADLTPMGQCLMRVYKADKTFVSESQVSLVSGKCPAPNIVDNQIYIGWQMEPGSTIDATFSSSGLKLPKYSDTLRKVTLQVWGWSDAEGKTQLNSQVVIFKR